jgi:hypothetical protein
MGERLCGVCRKKYRGAGTVVITGNDSARSKTATVIGCPRCVKRGFVVVPKGGTAACGKCGAPASLCGGCARDREPRDRAKLVEDVVVLLEGRLRAFKETDRAGETTTRRRIATGRSKRTRTSSTTLRGGRY